MGGEDTLPLNSVDIGAVDRLSALGLGAPVQQFQREEAGMALVHVEPGHIMVTQCADHSDPTDAEDDLLADAVVGVAAVEKMRDASIPLSVLRQIRVQKQNRHEMIGDATQFVTPRSQRDGSVL